MDSRFMPTSCAPVWIANLRNRSLQSLAVRLFGPNNQFRTYFEIRKSLLRTCNAMSFASIFVPDFPVEALLRAEPELRAQPVAVLEGKPPLQKIFGLNEKARRAGLELGMTRLQADICPDLVF